MGNICNNNVQMNGDVDLKNKRVIKANYISSQKLIGEEKNNNKLPDTSSILGQSKYNKAKSVRPKETESEYLTKNEYNKRVFDLINKIRINPPEYSKVILDNIKNIIYETHLMKNEETGEDEDKRLCIFKKKVKVTLNKGEQSFQEAAKILEETSSMEKFKFKDNIVLPLPKNEEEILNHKFINNKANEIMKKTKINFYFQEYIKNPEVAVLMMIVDDNKNMNGTKRHNLLNPELKYIGINSTFIGRNFVAYFSFSK